MTDLHMHSILSDGELIPAELVRRAMCRGHEAIAITDHVDMCTVDAVVASVVKAAELSEDYIRVIPGVEITHVPPRMIGKVAKRARELGAVWIAVHGETVAEPVMKGTNAAAAECPDVDMLAHPGLISGKDMQTAAGNGVVIEITGRGGHNITNGHVASLARTYNAKIVINSDTHSPDNIMDTERARAVALGAGLSEEEARAALETNPKNILKRLGI